MENKIEEETTENKETENETKPTKPEFKPVFAAMDKTEICGYWTNDKDAGDFLRVVVGYKEQEGQEGGQLKEPSGLLEDAQTALFPFEYLLEALKDIQAFSKVLKKHKQEEITCIKILLKSHRPIGIRATFGRYSSAGADAGIKEIRYYLAPRIENY